jgi:hypothetical protein
MRSQQVLVAVYYALGLHLWLISRVPSEEGRIVLGRGNFRGLTHIDWTTINRIRHQRLSDFVHAAENCFASSQVFGGGHPF